jgi:hypothetical protein
MTPHDETVGLDRAVRARLIFDGMLFSTVCSDRRKPGTIIARDWDHAEEVALGRPYGETVEAQIQYEQPAGPTMDDLIARFQGKGL